MQLKVKENNNSIFRKIEADVFLMETCCSNAIGLHIAVLRMPGQKITFDPGIL